MPRVICSSSSSMLVYPAVATANEDWSLLLSWVHYGEISDDDDEVLLWCTAIVLLRVWACVEVLYRIFLFYNKIYLLYSYLVFLPFLDILPRKGFKPKRSLLSNFVWIYSFIPYKCYEIWKINFYWSVSDSMIKPQLYMFRGLSIFRTGAETSINPVSLSIFYFDISGLMRHGHTHPWRYHPDRSSILTIKFSWSDPNLHKTYRNNKTAIRVSANAAIYM